MNLTTLNSLRLGYVESLISNSEPNFEMEQSLLSRIKFSRDILHISIALVIITALGLITIPHELENVLSLHLCSYFLIISQTIGYIAYTELKNAIDCYNRYHAQRFRLLVF